METEPKRTDKSPKRTNKSPKKTDESPKKTNKSSKKTDESSKKTDEAAVESEHPELQTAAGVSHTSPKLVAVISAAIAAARGKAVSDLRIASLRQVGQVAPQVDLWAKVGRIEAMNSRQRFFERKGK